MAEFFQGYYEYLIAHPCLVSDARIVMILLVIIVFMSVYILVLREENSNLKRSLKQKRR